MYFSVIIPTYNPKPFLSELLTSITRNECKDEIEVIISDDCSDEPFCDVLKSFEMLNVKVITNDKHYGFPRNGRQNGANMATGKWICFADQDDYYVDNAFDKIKKFIEENSVTKYFGSDFIQHKVLTDEYIVKSGSEGWTHGKFYEKSFWDSHDLHYDNVDYCEDINLTTKCGCIMMEENEKFHICHDPVYIWNNRPGSLCDDSYFVKSMPDYIKGTIGVIADYVEKYKYNKDLLESYELVFMKTLYHIYFYCQNDIVSEDKESFLSAIVVLLPYYRKFLSVTGFTDADIISRTAGDLRGMFMECLVSDYQQVSFFISMSFNDWITAYLK